MSAEQINRTCFDNLLALKGCGDSISKSGLYSDDIDITKDFLNEIITRQFSGPQDFFNKKVSFAIKTITDQVLTFMAPNFRSSTLLDNYRIGYFQDNQKQIPGNGNLKGIHFDLFNCDSYLNLFISEIGLQVNKTGDVDVLVYDLIQDELLDSLTIACTANKISKIYPHKYYLADRSRLNLLFAYDTAGIDSCLTYLRKDCADCSGTKGVNNPYEIVTAVKIDPVLSKLKKNLKSIGDTGGLSIIHSLSCNHSGWLCSYANLLGLPALYKYGELVMEFAINVSPNDRTNTTEFLNVDELKARLSYFKEHFTESYNNLISSIKTPTDKNCYTCRTPIRHAIVLP